MAEYFGHPHFFVLVNIRLIAPPDSLRSQISRAANFFLHIKLWLIFYTLKGKYENNGQITLRFLQILHF
jgi:hypothetical protein